MWPCELRELMSDAHVPTFPCCRNPRGYMETKLRKYRRGKF